MSYKLGAPNNKKNLYTNKLLLITTPWADSASESTLPVNPPSFKVICLITFHSSNNLLTWSVAPISTYSQNAYPFDSDVALSLTRLKALSGPKDVKSSLTYTKESGRPFSTAKVITRGEKNDMLLFHYKEKELSRRWNDWGARRDSKVTQLITIRFTAVAVIQN